MSDNEETQDSEEQSENQVLHASTHALARILLDSPDMPVLYGEPKEGGLLLRNLAVGQIVLDEKEMTVLVPAGKNEDSKIKQQSSQLNAPKNTTELVPLLFTDQELKSASKWVQRADEDNSSAADYLKRHIVTEEKIKTIDAELGQENDRKYFAYLLEYFIRNSY